MDLYLAVRPEDTQAASACRAGLAHAAYRIGADSALLSRNLLLQTRGGLLVLSDREAPPVRAPASLAEALLRECARRDYRGMVLDFAAPHRGDLGQLAAELSRRCTAGRRQLFVPEPYAGDAAQRTVIVNTAVSGGSFEAHIREAVSFYGGGKNVAFDLQRLQMSFPLPARDGTGTPLESAELRALMQAVQPAVFFSRDLCARYFTCTQQGETRFLLFDDAETLRQKLRLGQQLGISAAFFQWPEVQDIAAALFRRR